MTRRKIYGNMMLSDVEKQVLLDEAARFGVKPAALARLLILGSIRRGHTEALLIRYHSLLKKSSREGTGHGRHTPSAD